MLPPKIRDIRMKISKKHGLIVALIAITFFSVNSTSSSNYQGGFTITETTSERPTPFGGRETKITKDYRFNLLGNSSNDLVVMKEGGTKKK